jgi:hypothetical protein
MHRTAVATDYGVACRKSGYQIWQFSRDPGDQRRASGSELKDGCGFVVVAWML